MSQSLSRRRERIALSARLRAEGLSWVEVAEVLRSRHGVNARAALRLAHGWSQRQAAEEWNARWPDDLKSAKNFSYWETWPVSGHAPSLATLDRLARLYQCSMADLLVDCSDYRYLDEGTPPVLDDVRNLWDRSLGRRELLAGAGPGPALDAAAAAVPGPAGGDLAEALEATAGLTATYWRLEGLFGPKTVYAQALDHHRVLTGWLRHSEDGDLWCPVADLAANAGVLVGWLHFDLEQYEQAAAVYRRTLDLADRLGDANLQSFVTGRMSRTLSECERHPEALAMAEMAERLGAGAGPSVRSWLAATRAYVHACVGDDRSSRGDLDRAFGLLDGAGAERPPAYIAYYGRPNMQKWAGHTLLRLAEHRAARPSEGRSAIDEALSIWPGSGVRESGEVLVAAASARLAEREVDEAVALTGRAYDVAARTGSPRVLRHVIRVRQRMTPYGRSRAVRELDDRLLAGAR
ncbi:MAG TPA: hypothetical protein VKB57_18770 [Acidimicrobiales bacterium]|nr:hypothetical protein [Acidimicrobiales bacterium]